MALPTAVATPPPRPFGAPVRPSGWWYLPAIGLALVGFVVGVGVLVNGVHSARDTGREATRLELGRSAVVTFDRAASFTVYYLGPREVDDPSQVPQLAARLGVVITPSAGGPDIVMEPYASRRGISYGQSGFQQVALSTFHVDDPGDYVMRSNTLDGVSSSEAQLVVSSSPFRPLARSAVRALVLVSCAGLISVIATVALAVTRGRSKRALALAAATATAGAAPWRWPSQPAAPFPGGYGVVAPSAPPIVPPPPPGYGPPNGR